MLGVFLPLLSVSLLLAAASISLPALALSQGRSPFCQDLLGAPNLRCIESSSFNFKYFCNLHLLMREFKALPCAFAVRFLSLAPSLSPCCFPRQRAVGAACVGARSGLFFWRPQVCGLYPFPCDFEEMPLLSWRKENKVVGSREVFSSLKSSGYSALQLLFQVLSVPQVGRSCAPGPFGFAEMSTILKCECLV